MRARNSARERASSATGDAGFAAPVGWVGRWVNLTVNAILSQVVGCASRLVRLTVCFSVFARLLAPGRGYLDLVLRANPPGEPFDTTRRLQAEFDFSDQNLPVDEDEENVAAGSQERCQSPGGRQFATPEEGGNG